MKKIFGIVLAVLLCIGITGCSSNSSDSGNSKDSSLKTNEEVKKIFEQNGYETECGEDNDGEVDAFAKNHKSGQVFIFYGSSEELGLAFQSDSSVIFVDSKEVLVGSGDADEIYKKYEQEQKKLNLTKNEIWAYLKNEKKQYEDKMKDDLNTHNHYNEGVYEIGKDITEGEYLIVASDKIAKASFELQSTSYDSADTETYESEQAFKNHYVYAKNGQFLKVNNAYVYAINDRPTLSLQNNGMYKVGVDLEAGIYNIHPRNDAAYYAITVLDEEKQFDVETNGLGFTNDIQIKVNDGEYLSLYDVVISKAQ